MKISIITPTWNSEKTIQRNLDSVHRQREVEIEHIVIDNLSSDHTLKIIKDSGYQIRLISEKDKGISDAFNKGIKASSGEIVAILNSDDCFTGPHVLKKVFEVFNEKNVILSTETWFSLMNYMAPILEGPSCALSK